MIKTRIFLISFAKLFNRDNFPKLIHCPHANQFRLHLDAQAIFDTSNDSFFQIEGDRSRQLYKQKITSRKLLKTIDSSSDVRSRFTEMALRSEIWLTPKHALCDRIAEILNRSRFELSSKALHVRINKLTLCNL